jgi:hypothetical protein
VSPDDAVSPDDMAIAGAQLGRPVRGMLGVAHRCPCGNPDVIVTAPRLDDGTPFPTTFYLTCPRAVSAIGTLEASGLMRGMTQRLETDRGLATAYRAAHEDYLRRRTAFGDVPEVSGVSAGGMPDRVKCLHVLVAHALAAGPGVNPFGDEALVALDDWWAAGPCMTAADMTAAGMTAAGTTQASLSTAGADQLTNHDHPVPDPDRRAEEPMSR